MVLKHWDTIHSPAETLMVQMATLPLKEAYTGKPPSKERVIWELWPPASQNALGHASDPKPFPIATELGTNGVGDLVHHCWL